MPEATFWFSSPFREWVGQRTIAVRWEGRITLREVIERLAADHPKFQAHAVGAGLRQDTFSNLAAVIVEGDFLALDDAIDDGAQVSVFTPLAGGRPRPGGPGALWGCRRKARVGGRTGTGTRSLDVSPPGRRRRDPTAPPWGRLRLERGRGLPEH